MSHAIDEFTAGLDLPESIRQFAHAAAGRVEFGAGLLDDLGAFCAEQADAGHVFLVSDPGIAKAGHIERAVEAIRNADLDVTVFDDVHENPTTEDVDRAVCTARAAGIDVLVGLGGGSSMDTAKGCNFLLSNGGEMRDYRGVGKAEKPMLPFIAVPTTAGTGSECQSFALIADAATHMKMACGDKKSAARIALLDPELTLTKPASVTAHTGIDALTHALETAVCNQRTEISSAYSRVAWDLLDAGFPQVIDDPKNLDARSRVLLGAAYAGTAIENSMLGAAHACANPLTAQFGIVHGEAVGIMLPHVIALNRRNAEADEIYTSLGPDLESRVTELLEIASVPSRLRDLGINHDALPALATAAATQWTAQFNPVEVGQPELADLYQSAL